MGEFGTLSLTTAASCNFLFSCVVSILTCLNTRVDNTCVESYRHGYFRSGKPHSRFQWGRLSHQAVYNLRKVPYTMWDAETPQASSPRYLLWVVTVLVVVTTVTSFTIVPNSSPSACRARVQGSASVVWPSYVEGEPEPSLSDNSCERESVFSTLSGKSFHT